MQIMINGLPGNMSSLAAKTIAKKSSYKIVPFAFTGPEITAASTSIEGQEIALIKPDGKAIIDQIKKDYGGLTIVDFSHPSAVNKNIEFYCSKKINFVCGTTGVDMAAAQKKIADAGIIAVVAPNTGKQIVALLSMIQYAADNFPEAFKGYSLEIVESHQRGKADISGTARATVPYFNKLGLPIKDGDIKPLREPEEQKRLGVPESFLGGHAWHTYSLKSPDESVLISFTHNVNGRQIYADGVVDCLDFLNKKGSAGESGKMFSMMDVLKG
ncbi:MAG: dihydrodipicolinate reductase [Deltaproteobacteria bacterium]|nr:dihydrodipicolinate reductase [Deltaproteobacteria bacterium]